MVCFWWRLINSVRVSFVAVVMVYCSSPTETDWCEQICIRLLQLFIPEAKWAGDTFTSPCAKIHAYLFGVIQHCARVGTGAIERGFEIKFITSKARVIREVQQVTLESLVTLQHTRKVAFWDALLIHCAVFLMNYLSREWKTYSRHGYAHLFSQVLFNQDVIQQSKCQSASRKTLMQ